MADVVAYGEAMLRLTAAEGERLRDADQLSLHVAGAECNVAVALARLGADVAWVSSLPDSPLGHGLAERVQASRVELHITWVHAARLGLFFADAGVAPRPTSVLYDRAGSAFTEGSAFESAVLSGARFAVLSGITLALGVKPMATAQRFVTAAAAAGALLCLDVNYRSQLWDPAGAREGLAPFLAAASIVVCARRDARTVFGLEGEPSAVLAGLRDHWAPRARTLVLTDGPAGATGLDQEGEALHAPARPTSVIDRFGAGDAFLAGMLWGSLQGWSLAERLRCATTLAALKCTVRGDQSRTTADELDTALAVPDGLTEAIVR